MTGFIQLSGDHLPITDLKITKAKQLAESLGSQNYVSFLDCIREPSGWEVIVFDIEVEVPQKKAHDIQRIERIAVRFDPLDASAPEALALRPDFPAVPHLNLCQDEFPRSLCIFDEPYNELKLHWTAPFYIRNIREWLALTARAQLHADDQPLEPLLFGSEGHLVLPPAIFDRDNPAKILAINQVVNTNNQTTLVAKAVTSLSQNQDEAKLLITILYAETQTHGLIRSRPSNLTELHTFLESGNLDLLNHLRQQLRQWKEDPAFDAVKEAKLITLILLPKARSDVTADFESVEMRAFVTESSIVEIGVEIGIWGIFNGAVGQILSVDDDKTGERVVVSMLNPMLSLSADLASSLSALECNTDLKLAAVGIGALGSQVILNLIRMGYGQWTLIDDDILLPHNLVRHALTEHFVGYSKAVGLSILASQMMEDNNVANPLIENVLKPSDPGKLSAAFNDAQVILDASTSIAVARHLTHDIDSDARRISLFLNPSATDVVILAEDNGRKVKLDMLEMQYYRGLTHEPDLTSHLQRSDERVRYGTSCRDLSSRIPQDLVALHSAACSRALRRIIEDDEATIAIWSTNPMDMTTKKYRLSIGDVTEIEFSDWTLIVDGLFLDKVTRFRESKLPNETGGVLIGSYDTDRKFVYVIDTIPAPPDSVEWPTVFIRGSSGLKQEVERVQSVTKGRLEYVGEWHSHPPGVRGIPSNDDIKAFSWLSEMMSSEGLPALMLIAADNNENNFYVGQMKRAR